MALNKQEASVAAAIGKAAGALTVLAINVAFYGWLFMLAVGAIHGEWLHSVPTVGFWSASLVSFIVRVAVAAMVGTGSRESK